MVRNLAGYDAPFGFAAMGVVMEPITATLSVLGAVSSIGGTIAGMGSSMAAGRAGKIGAAMQGQAAMQSAEYRATQLRQQAQEARASQQRAALETRRKGGLVQSTLRARAAAGGGGATDNTVLDLTGQIAERTEYESLLEMYKGENAARGMEDAANAAIYQGKVGVVSAGLQGDAIEQRTRGTIAQSAGSLASQVFGLGSKLGGLNLGGGPTLPDTTYPTNTGWASPVQRF
jgi:hypothetical protein